MTRPAEIPSEPRAHHIRDQYLADCAAEGQRPSVLGLATRLGLTNTTFRRHFPDLASQISTARAAPAQSAGLQHRPSPHDTLTARNAKLRRANRTLTQQLQLAAAHIQRLGIDNARLRGELEASSNVTRIDRPDRSRSAR
jgi:predicted ArsR family transcriptional regulator